MKAIRPELKIGLTLSLHDFQAIEGGEALAEKEWEEEFVHYLPYMKEESGLVRFLLHLFKISRYFIVDKA